MEVVCDKTADEASCADDFVFVELEDHFVGGVDTDVADGLRGDFVFVEDVDFDDAIGTEVDYILTRVSAAEVEDHFFVWVEFWVFAQVVVVFDAVPHDADCRKVL